MKVLFKDKKGFEKWVEVPVDKNMRLPPTFRIPLPYPRSIAIQLPNQKSPISDDIMQLYVEFEFVRDNNGQRHPYDGHYEEVPS